MVSAKFFDELSAREVYEILAARSDVFVREQGIRCLDPDGVDYSALHIFISEGERVVAYLRAFPTEGEDGCATVGRVLTRTHGKGDGRRLMEAAIPEIRQRMGVSEILVHAQCHASGFYGKFGFAPSSEVFLEEGIEHIEMRLRRDKIAWQAYTEI